MKKFSEMNKLEREIEVIKCCHTPKNITEIADELNADERIIRRIVNEYIPDFEFPVMHIDVDKAFVNHRQFVFDSEPKDEFQSTVHPICLALNLTEVYLLTIGLLSRIPPNDIMYDVYVRLLSKIYTQLSDYGKGVLEATHPNHNLSDIRYLRYENESDVFKSLPATKIAYAQKAGVPIMIRWKEPDCDLINEVETYIKYEGGVFSFSHKGKTITINPESINILDIKICNRK
jgi:hypothetical protein